MALVEAPAPRYPPNAAYGRWDDQAEWQAAGPARVPERGLAGWQALAILLIIAGIGGAIDLASGTTVRGGFNIGLIIASLVAILVVRRSSMFTIVVAPPLVYAVASVAILYLRSNGLHNRSVLLEAAGSWLVYGFPSIAAATAAVLLIAVIRGVRGRFAR